MPKQSKWLKIVFLIFMSFVLLVGCNKYNEETTTPPKENEQEQPDDDAVVEDPGAPQKDVFNFATNQDIPHLDPHGTSANTSFRVTYMLYDRLVTYDGTTTEVVPQLAENWEISEDGTTYTFFLRKDAKFHDGSPVTSAAVEYSFRRAIDIGKSAAGIFSKVIDENSFEIVDDHTIKIKLLKPFGPFIKALGTVFGNILNPNLADNHGEDLGESYLADKEVGSGPYVLESWDRGQKLVLKANENYWGGTPTMKTVNINIVPEPSTARLMLEKGELDLLDDTMISPDVIKQMDGKNGVEIVNAPGFQIDYFPMNMTQKPLDNKLVRQAIAHAINYDVIIDNVFLGNGERIGGIVPKGMFGYNDGVKEYDYNLDKAKELLKEAGQEGGFTVEMAISENNEVRRNIAVMLQSDLAKIGVTVDIKTYAWPTFLDLVTSGKHDFGLVAWTPDYADPDYNLWYFAHSSSKGPGFNLAFYENKRIDELLELARKSVDDAQRDAAYKEIQAIMAEDVPYIFLAQRSVQAAKREWVERHEINPMNTWYVPFHKITKK
ncbi:ABC transporter substrate-binding protein [Pseudoneobacillus rhizosphaerae]|uniref:D,D-dipeptide-binding periplasmic protein DdpA n=1 Tax=Pseudoneobacillus rhizosphaerae TaxID=2880968 RepID=A0A9C7LAR1_9BACI|nr:ABC transporter substrate-binding protein [Pseudoneobacillus rhizosphaerae]CAG9607725.1 putative D,D-dipeptide-binding periplasmic protein DdpA [Pseudoneobacillus rhizosphaerae]